MGRLEQQKPPAGKKGAKDWFIAAGVGALGGAVAGYAAHQGKTLGFVAFVALAVVVMAVRGVGTRLVALGAFGVVAAVVAAIFQR